VIAITELRREFKLMELLEFAKIAKSTYYYHLKRLDAVDKYAEIKKEILLIFTENKGRYGYRRITLELKNRKRLVNHKTVQRLMKELGLKSLIRVRKYCSYKGEAGKVAPNLLNRNFKSEKPNVKWVTDVTEFSLFGEKLYLSPVLDLYNGEIIAYEISHRPVFKMITNMMEKAVLRLKKKDRPILHSDQGLHYQMEQYQGLLMKHNIKQSMSRKGNCLDNAVIENFFGHLKSELLYIQKFENMHHFIKELEDYIYYYNHKRIKNKLNGLSPIQYRIQSKGIA
jgi:putative transposase